MGEILSMDVPPQKPSRKRARLLLAVAVLLLALLLAGLALLWLSGSSVQSRWAALDADSQVLTAPYSAPVENVFVSEGTRVSSGQALLRLSNEGLLRQQEQAGHDLSALRSDMVRREVATERLQRAQAAWEGMVSRLTIARHEEELRAREREQKSVEHVRAQLALRGMAVSGGPAYEKAARKEAEARVAMEQATKRFEQANQERAEAERDVMALRDEIQKAKRVAGPAAGVTTASGGSLPSLDGVLTSAQDGLVLRVQTAQGQTVQRQQPLMEIVPSSSDHWWVLAYFPAEQAGLLRRGMRCRVIVGGSKEALDGEIAELAPAESIAMPDSRDGPRENVVPARISIPGVDMLARGWKPGQPAVCEVDTGVFRQGQGS